MDASDKALVATVAYYTALERPITALEAWERLIPVSRFGGRESLVLGAVVGRLDALTASGVLTRHHGYFVVGSSGSSVERYLTEERIAAVAFRALRRAAWWLQLVPFVRGLFVSGSLASGAADEDSDWDLFVVVQAGRLYTARTLLLIAALLLGRLRTKRSRVLRGKFCFNHYVTTDGLASRHRSLFTAHTLAWLVPLYDPWGYLSRLWQANRWIEQYCSHTGGRAYVQRSLAPSPVLGAVRRIIELPLHTGLGAALEYALRRWQQRRIRREPATYAPGGRVVADTRELEFHPHSFEAVALARYNALLTRINLGQHRERDSGLNH
jgi:hypothetical protein